MYKESLTTDFSMRLPPQVVRAMFDRIVELSLAEGDDGSAAAIDSGEAFDEAVSGIAGVEAVPGMLITRSHLPKVKGNRVQLTHVFRHLMTLALSHRDDKLPRLHVSADRDGAAWRFSIQDLAPAGVRSTRRGTGSDCLLRLPASCGRIVERHGGRLWAETSCDGATRYCFSIPCDGAASPDVI